MSPVLGSRSQVFTTSTSAGGGGGSSPGGTAPGPVLGGRSQVFRVEADGGGGGASPGGTAPGPVLGGRAQVFMVLPSGEIAMVTCSCCGITDTFSRVVASPDWGNADIYDPVSGEGYWTLTDANVGTTMGWEATVEGTYGRLWAEGGAGNPAAPTARLYGIGVWQTFRLTFRVKFVTFDTVTETVYVNFNVVSSAGASQVNFTLGDGIYLSSNGVGGTTRVDFDPTPGTWYRVRFEQDEDDELRVRVWADGDTEPGTWTLVKDVSAQTDWSGPTEFRIDAAQVDSGDPGTSDLEVHVDDLDIEDVGSCMFDNFNRVETGTWGDTTPGNVSYDSIPPSAGSMGVADGRGFVEFTGGVDQGTAEIVADGPWRTSAGFVMTADFEVDPLPPIGQTSNVEIAVFHDSGNLYDGIALTLTTDNVPAPADSSLGLWHDGVQPDALADPPTLVRFTGQTGVWFVKWEYRPPLSRVRFWHESDDEPDDWAITVSDTVHSGDETFWASFIHVGAGATTTFIDNITFDTGCFLDDYNRTVAPAAQPDLGVTELGGHAYTWMNGNVTGAVSIENGYLRFKGPASGEGFVEHALTIGDGYLIDELATHTSSEIRFRTSLIMANQPSDATEFSFEPRGTGNYEVNIKFDSVIGYVRVNQGTGIVSAAAAPEPDRIEKDDWVADAWYVVKCVADGQDIRIKIWLESDGEPEDYQIATEASFPWVLEDGALINLTLEFDTGTGVGPFYDHTFDLDYIKLSSMCEA